MIFKILTLIFMIINTVLFLEARKNYLFNVGKKELAYKQLKIGIVFMFLTFVALGLSFVWG